MKATIRSAAIMAVASSLTLMLPSLSHADAPAAQNGQETRMGSPGRSVSLRQAFRAVSASPEQNRAMITAVQNRDADAVTAILSVQGHAVRRGTLIVFPQSPEESRQTRGSDLVLAVATVGGGGSPPEPRGLVKVGGVWVDWRNWDGNMWWIRHRIWG